MDLHMSVSNTDYPEATIQMVLDHGEVLESTDNAERLVYGYLTVVRVHDQIIAVYDRDRIGSIERTPYEQLNKHHHFYQKLNERDLYEEEVRDVVNNGILFYNQHSWYYVGSVNGHEVRIIREQDTLKTVYWEGDNPRDWDGRDDVTDAYMDRRRKRHQATSQTA